MFIKLQNRFLIGASLGIMLATLLLPSKSYADLIPEGYHNVDYSIIIQNVKDYPDYYFFLRKRIGKSTVTYSPIYSDTNVKLHKSALTGLVAANKKISNIQAVLKNIEKLNNLNSDAGPVRSKQERTKTKKYNDMVDKNLVHSDTKIVAVSTSNNYDPTIEIVDIYKIISIDKKIQLRPIKVIYTYKNGNAEEKNYINSQERPGPSIALYWLSILWYLLPILSFTLILFIVFRKK